MVLELYISCLKCYMNSLFFFKFHEICFKNVLVKCYVFNKYVFLVSLIYLYING